MRKRIKAKRKYVTRKKLQEQALIQAREMPEASEGLNYKVSVDTDGDRLELFTKQPYAAILASRALADTLHAQSHVSLGTYIVASESPRLRRRKDGRG